MYFFYIDESGSRDPSIGTPEKPKDHLYVLLAVGLFERQWQPFDRKIAEVKLELVERLRRAGKIRFELADCEVKSNWLRNPKEREARSPFLNALTDAERERLVAACAFSIRWHPFSLNSVTPEGLSVSFMLPRDQRSRPPEATGGCSGCSIDMRCRSYGAPA